MNQVRHGGVTRAKDSNIMNLYVIFIATLITILTLFTLSFAVAASEKTYRVDYPFHSNLMDANYRGNFSPYTEKKDVVIIGRHVSVDKLIETNGGNVYIFGETIEIAAPIDTRVYFKMIKPYWIPKNGNLLALNEVLQRFVRGQPDRLNSFDALYFWRDIYKSEKKLFQFEQSSEPWPREALEETFRRPELMKDTALPQLPSGQVPIAFWALYQPEGANGEDAPDEHVLWEQVKSGNIHLFAHKIKFCDDCGFVDYPKMVWAAGGDFGDQIRPIFLQAGGIKGGRGGQGAPPACSYAKWEFCRNSKPPCAGNITICDAWENQRPARSGNHGRGGDAGSVFVHYINNEFESTWQRSQSRVKMINQGVIRFNQALRVYYGNHKRTITETVTSPLPNTPEYDANVIELLKLFGRQSICALTNVEGGFPVQWHQNNTGSYYDLTPSEVRLWPKFGPVWDAPITDKVYRWNRSFAGAHGRIQIENLTTNKALSKFAALLAKVDLRRDYDFKKIIKESGTNPNAFTVSPHEQFDQYLIDELVNLQLSYVASMRKYFNDSDASLAYSPVLQSVSCDKPVAGFTVNQKAIIDKICEFESYSGMDNVRSYLVRTGGLLSTKHVSVNNALRHRQIIVALTNLGEKLTEVIVNLENINLTLDDMLNLEISSNFQSSIEALISSINNLQSQIPEAKDIFSKIKDLKGKADSNIEQLEKSGKDLVAAYYSNDGFGIIGSGVTIIEAIGNLTSSIDKLFADDLIPSELLEKISKINRALTEVRIAYREFVDSARIEKNQALGRRNDNLAELFKARHTYVSSIQTSRFAFGDLVKLLLRHYRYDPGTDKSKLNRNINALEYSVRHPDLPTSMSDWEGLNLCKRKDPKRLEDFNQNESMGCVILKTEDTKYGIFISKSPKSKLSEFPLIIIPKGGGEEYKVSFDYMVTPSEIEKRVIDLKGPDL